MMNDALNEQLHKDIHTASPAELTALLDAERGWWDSGDGFERWRRNQYNDYLCYPSAVPNIVFTTDIAIMDTAV